MFFHIVMMRLTKVDTEFLDQVQALADRIRAECDGLLTFHIGENAADRAAGFGYVTTSAFVDEAAHEAYQTSDAHVKLKALMGPRMADIVVYDGVIPMGRLTVGEPPSA